MGVQKLISIQYLRAAAASGVLVFHSFERQDVHVLGDIGAAGVDLFFVISGFIMWWLTSEKPASPRRFILDRVIRIVPLYWLCTLALCAMAILVPSAFHRLRVDGDHVLLSMFFVPHYSPSDGSLFPLAAAGWTLNYEMFFYSIFALLLLFSKNTRFFLLIGAFLLLVLAGSFYHGQNPLVLTYTNIQLLEFGAGVLLGRLWELPVMPRAAAGPWLVWAGILGFAASAILVPPEKVRILAWGLPAFMLVTGSLVFERARAVPSRMLLEKIGDASYSIYLTHGFVLAALAKGWGHASNLPSLTGYLVIGVLSSLFAGWLCHIWVEKPLIAVLRGRYQGRRLALAGAGAPPSV